MTTPKLLAVFGTRPEAIKMAPLLHRARHLDTFSTYICLSGQHKDAPEEILSLFGLTADQNLDLLRDGASLSSLSARALEAFDRLFAAQAPDAVAVHGDTATAFCAFLAAFYRHIPVFHIEAGLRSGNPFSPFPEELYRRCIDAGAALCFAPTEGARQSLLREGRRDGDIFVTGNTGIDALRFTVQKDFSHPILEKAAGKKLVLLTAHRRENHGEPFRRILRAVKAAMRAREDALLLFVMHPNPLLQGEAHALLSDAENILLSPPLSPIVFQNLLSRATLLLTDSGGAQEEATALGIPTLVLREETERPEGARAGTLFPVGTDEAALLFHITSFLAHPPKTSPSLCYGDGGASQIILNRLENYFLHGSCR